MKLETANKQPLWWEYCIFTNNIPGDDEDHDALEDAFQVSDIKIEHLPEFCTMRNFLIVYVENMGRSFIFDMFDFWNDNHKQACSKYHNPQEAVEDIYNAFMKVNDPLVVVNGRGIAEVPMTYMLRTFPGLFLIKISRKGGRIVYKVNTRPDLDRWQGDNH